MIAEFLKVSHSLESVLREAGSLVLQRHHAAAISFCSGMGLAFVVYTVLEVWSAPLEILLSALLAAAFAFRRPDFEKFETDLTTLGEFLKKKLKATIEQSVAEIREIVPGYFLGYINSLQDQLLGNKLTEMNLYPPPLSSSSFPPSLPLFHPPPLLSPAPPSSLPPAPPLLPPLSLTPPPPPPPPPTRIEEGEEAKEDENKNKNEVKEEENAEEENEEVKSAEDSDVTSVEFSTDDVFVFGFLMVSIAYLSANAAWRVFQSTAFRFVSSVVLRVTTVVALTVGQVAIYIKYYQDIRELVKMRKKKTANVPPDQLHGALGERAQRWVGQVGTMETKSEEDGMKEE